MSPLLTNGTCPRECALFQCCLVFLVQVDCVETDGPFLGSFRCNLEKSIASPEQQLVGNLENDSKSWIKLDPGVCSDPVNFGRGAGRNLRVVATFRNIRVCHRDTCDRICALVDNAQYDQDCDNFRHICRQPDDRCRFSTGRRKLSFADLGGRRSVCHFAVPKARKSPLLLSAPAQTIWYCEFLANWWFNRSL